MATTPSQSVELVADLAIAAPASEVQPSAIDPTLLDQLWQETEAELCGITRTEFSGILLQRIAAQNEKQSPESALSPTQQAALLRTLKLADLILARACARGIERAWQRFLTLYQQPLTRAAIAITNSETLGRDLADSLYAELYGLTTHDGERRSPLNSYQGRGSLLGWLRTTLAQRHVDHHRRTHRESSIEEHSETAERLAQSAEPIATEPAIIVRAVKQALAKHPPEDCFLLASYYLDQRTLHQIGNLLHVHEATISRKLHRITKDLRKQVVTNLQSSGLSKRAAEEALGTDPRDIELDLRKILQTTQPASFQEEAMQEQAFQEKTGQ